MTSPPRSSISHPPNPSSSSPLQLMESTKPKKSKLAKTFHKVIHLKTSTKSLSNNGFCLLIPQDKCYKPKNNADPTTKHRQSPQNPHKESSPMEAFAAKLFASISVLKSAYAELQMAQFPYNGDAIQVADQAVVSELKALSELKQSFLRKQIDPSPPHVTLLLAEIQEQQSHMKMHEINTRRMEREKESKETQISLLDKQLAELCTSNKALEDELNSSGLFSVLDGVKPSDSNPRDYITVLHYAVRSIRRFVKVLVLKMESGNWDVDVAVNAIEPDLKYPNPTHRCFAVESFVCREMFDGFNSFNFCLPNEAAIEGERRRLVYSDRFKSLKSANPIEFLKQNRNSIFGKFIRAKYFRLVHPKMEILFWGNLNQRKLVGAWDYPETAFFAAFAEMARRVWLLHCLAFSFEMEVEIFQLKKGCRVSEVYMESVTDDAVADGAEFRVALTVVPGFKIGKTVIQSQVYLSAVAGINSPAECFK